MKRISHVAPVLSLLARRGSNARFKSKSLSVTLGGGCLAAMSIGAPSGCLGILSSDEVPATTTTTTYGSASNPAVVTRDNLAMGGTMSFTDTSVRAAIGVSKVYSDATWTSQNNVGAPTLTGHAVVREFRADGSHYLDQYTPLLPDQSFSGSGAVSYGMRAGTMVHGNTYAISSVAREAATGETLALNNTTYVQLSPQTLVVPVVIVTWRGPDALVQTGQYKNMDMTVAGRNMFDYNPLSVPKQASPDPYSTVIPAPLPGGGFWAQITPLANAVTEALTATQVDSPVASFFRGSNAPDGMQLPIDDVWSQCNIQFQVVAQVQAQLPVNWNPQGCSTISRNLSAVGLTPEDVFAAQFSSNPKFRDYVLFDLQPIFVSFGDMHMCSFSGNTPGKDRFVEISTNVGNGHYPVGEVTAHELGHALSLDHEWLDTSVSPAKPFSASDSTYPQDSSNLMASGGESTTPTLYPEQCIKAQGAAKAFSSRFDYFNGVTGRTGWNGTPPPPSNTYTVPTAGGTGSGITLGNYCCLQGSAAVSSTTACTTQTLDGSQCVQVCCVVSGTATNESQYQCTQQGGTISANACPTQG